MDNRRRNPWGNLWIAFTFALLVAAAGSLPGRRPAVDPALAPVMAFAAPAPVGESCSLAAFQRLQANIQHLRRGISPRRAAVLAGYIWQAAHRFHCDPQLIAALIHVESSFFTRARSSRGARGLMQLRPFVARAIARQLQTAWHGPETLHDPRQNITMGTCYLASLMRQFPDLQTALAAYNYGPTYIRRRLRQGGAVPRRYPRKVLSLYQAFGRGQKS
ncbi:MAG: lytic transglycosylase domain-containing protein [Deltaproteobacteria bacterium]|nr:lytic transglycosylase domain-containing protein [Deltaproteobacteria bacterium]